MSRRPSPVRDRGPYIYCVVYGRICDAAVSAGRKPRRRAADLMIAAIAAAEELPLFTTDPDDFEGLDDLITIVPVTRSEVLHDR